ncbi:TetR/AcrR family transcriptional regulator [Actinoalloteichus hymeniacidonis]|nr:TetR/AcrR family transcriptional regulator [Actinoalloteichus hymeniacidonis]MBB5908001.1 AcrR family transcriptional regulator [Actinoalloteichus hymeniacidonis]
MRADARRSYDRILKAADAAIARDGATTSLEEIARNAGVGSATLHRHFPSRRALLNAVFHDRIEGICAQAHRLIDAPDAGVALIDWLGELCRYSAKTRGLAPALLQWAGDDRPLVQDSSCHSMLHDAGDRLLRRAREAGQVRPEVSIDDLLTLVNAISLVTEANSAAIVVDDEADRLFAIAVEGIRPATN